MYGHHASLCTACMIKSLRRMFTVTSCCNVQLVLEHVRSGERYEFVHNDWINVDSEHDGWVELPLQTEKADDTLPGESCFR